MTSKNQCSHFAFGLLLSVLSGSGAWAWDYTTSNPCDTPVAHVPGADVAYPSDHPIKESFSATIDLNVPLSSQMDTSSYNADLSRTDIDAGTAMVTQDGTYLNVLGNEVTPTDPPEATGCR